MSLEQNENKLENLIFKYQQIVKEQNEKCNILLREYNNKIEKLENNLEKENKNYEKINQQIEEYQKKINNNHYQIEKYKKEKEELEKIIKKIEKEKEQLEKENKNWKQEIVKNDNEKYQQSKEKINQYYTKETNKENLQAYLDLAFSDIDSSTLTKQKEKKSQSFDNLIDINSAELSNLTKEQEEINNELLNLTSNLNNIQKEKLPKNKQELEKLKQEYHQQENIIKNLKIKIENYKEEMKEKYNSINKEFQGKLKEYFENLAKIIENTVTSKNNDLVNKQEILEPIVAIKETIDKFLAKYFIEKNNINIEYYNSDFKQIKEIINNDIKDENLKQELINFWEFFNNWKTNISQKFQPVFNKLQANPGEIFNIIFKYQHLLNNYKGSFSHLLCVGSLKKEKIKLKNYKGSFSHLLCCVDNLLKNERIKLFAKIYSLDECNDEKKVIFNTLINKINDKKIKAKTSKLQQQYVVFNEQKNYGLLLLKNEEQELPFLIDFTILIKIPDNFYSLIIDNYEKKYILNVSKLDKIFNNILEQNKKRLLKFYTNKSITVTNNNLEFYIKELDLFFQKNFTEKNNLKQEILNLKESVEKIKDNGLKDLESKWQKNNTDEQQKTYEETLLKETWIILETVIKKIEKQYLNNQPKSNELIKVEVKPLLSQSTSISKQDWQEAGPSRPDTSIPITIKKIEQHEPSGIKSYCNPAFVADEYEITAFDTNKKKNNFNQSEPNTSIPMKIISRLLPQQLQNNLFSNDNDNEIDNYEKIIAKIEKLQQEKLMEKLEEQKKIIDDQIQFFNNKLDNLKRKMIKKELTQNLNDLLSDDTLSIEEKTQIQLKIKEAEAAMIIEKYDIEVAQEAM